MDNTVPKAQDDHLVQICGQQKRLLRALYKALYPIMPLPGPAEFYPDEPPREYRLAEHDYEGYRLARKLINDAMK